MLSYYYDFSSETDDRRHSRLFSVGFFLPRQSCPVDTHSPPKPPPVPPLGQHHRPRPTLTTLVAPLLLRLRVYFILFFYRPSRPSATAFSGWFRLAETNFHSDPPPTTRPLDLWQSSLNTCTCLCVWVLAWRAAVRRTLKYNIYVRVVQHTLQLYFRSI